MAVGQLVSIVDASGNPSGGGTSANPTVTQAQGSANIATNQVSVTTSATLVVAARAGRIKVTLSPTTSVAYFVGAAGVTSSNGVSVAAGSSITLDTAAAVYAVGASTVTMSYIEFY